MTGKIFALVALLASVNCRSLFIEKRPLHFADDGVFLGEGAEYFNGPLETIPVEPLYNSRERRQAQTTLSVKGKTGNAELSAKIPLATSDGNQLSLIRNQSPASHSFGLALDNENGHSLSFSQKTIPEFGKQLTAAGKVNLLHTDKHELNANGFLTNNMPKLKEIPDFNTYGGGVDYTYNNRIGASLDAAHTDILKRTDVTALGHLNLFRNKDTSFDVNAGATKSFSPFIPRTSWEPAFGFSISKSW